jgi:hypothetical protein
VGGGEDIGLLQDRSRGTYARSHHAPDEGQAEVGETQLEHTQEGLDRVGALFFIGQGDQGSLALRLQPTTIAAINARIAFAEDPDGIPVELWQDLG